MSQFSYIIILAVGFAMSGFVSSLYRLVTSQQAEFLPFSGSLTKNILAVLVSMFAGPFIIAGKIWAGMISKEMQIPLVVLLLVICSLWSFYSGVAVIYLSLPYVDQIQALVG